MVGLMAGVMVLGAMQLTRYLGTERSGRFPCVLLHKGRHCVIHSVKFRSSSYPGWLPMT